MMNDTTIDFETIGWERMSDAGYIQYSVSHMIESGSEKTLCGVTVPADADVSGDGGMGCCKRCRAIAKKLQTAE
jgi:hypothetical protein